MQKILPKIELSGFPVEKKKRIYDTIIETRDNCYILFPYYTHLGIVFLSCGLKNYLWKFENTKEFEEKDDVKIFSYGDFIIQKIIKLKNEFADYLKQKKRKS